MNGTSETIKIKKENHVYTVDHKIKSGKENIYGIGILRWNTVNTALLSMMDVHKQLGHPSAEITKAPAEKLQLRK